MTYTTDEATEARAAELLAASVPAAAVGWLAHRTASSRAQTLLDLMAERSGDPRWLAAAGYERGTRATDFDAARRAASQLGQALESVDLTAQYQALLAELLILLREDARLTQLLADGKLRALSDMRRQTLDADLANPFRTPGLSEHEWLRAVRPLLGDLAPVILAPARETEGYEPLDRLATDLVPGTMGRELVSVIVSSYRPGPALETAVRSILEQTWAELEILVIDDASGPDFFNVYAQIDALDERVRVIHQPENGGTYVARNTAIDQARGTYVTFQDADDWSHPERIQRQVAAFEQDPLVHSVRARSLRTSGDLVISRQGTAVLAPGAVTLMFRREQVWPLLGGYDPVRKAADTEFHERISAALPGYGVDLPEPLLWYRVGEESLSRSEFRAVWRHPARMLYHSAWARWHDEIRLGASPQLDRAVRRFPAPRRFLLDQAAPPDQVDLVVLGDWRGNASAARDAVDWIRLLATNGVRIALVHVERLNFDVRRPPIMMDAVRNLIAEGAVTTVPWDDPVATRAMVAIEPEVLEYLPDVAPGTGAASMVVLLDAAPRAAQTFASTEAIVKERWGSRVVWSPRGDTSRTMLAEDADVLQRPFPAYMPGEAHPPLHRPSPVVVVAPIGIAPEVLDETAAVSSALTDAGFDVRVRIQEGVRQAIQTRAGGLSPTILWTPPTSDAVAAELAIASDLVVIGPSCGIDFDRLMDDALIWGVRAHHRSGAHTPAGVEDIALDELVRLIRTAPPQLTPTAVNPQARVHAENAVRRWYAEVAALASGGA